MSTLGGTDQFHGGYMRRQDDGGGVGVAKPQNRLARRPKPERQNEPARENEPAQGRREEGTSSEHKPADKRPLQEILLEGLAICKQGMWTVGLFSVAVNLLMLTLPIYLFQITDRVLASGSIDTLIMLTIIAVGALAVLALLNVARRVLLTRIGMRFETLLGGCLLSSGLKRAGGEAVQGIQRLQDLNQVRMFITGPVMLNIFDAGMAPMYFTAVFLIHPDLGTIVLGGGLLLLVAAIANQKLTVDILNQANGYSMKAYMQAQAHARNAQVIRAMGMVGDSVRLWGSDNAQSLKAQAEASDRNVYLSGMSQFLRLVMQIGLLGWGAYLVLESELTGGMMIAASIIGARALAPVEAAIDGWRNLVSMRAASKRVSESISENVKERERMLLPRLAGRIEVDDVSYAPAPDKPAILHEITFALEPGTSLAIIGPSGAGKSTLARLLVGCLEPAAGAIRLDAMPLQNWNREQLGRSIGYLPQDVELFPGMIKDNIARMMDGARDDDIARAAEIAGVHEMISKLPDGYETEIGLDGQPLSGGQRQRVGLARAYFGDPAFVVLDEPNSNLDSYGEDALALALKRGKDLKITTVIVTQRPAILQSVDNILVLENGSIRAFGSRQSILPKLPGQGGGNAGNQLDPEGEAACE